MIIFVKYLCPLVIGKSINIHVTTITSRGKQIPIRRKRETSHLHRPR